jgi:CTP:molybdopterin cytidylyltransferase MocA
MVVMPAMMPQPPDRSPTGAPGAGLPGDLCAVVLAAGEGRRLRPLSLVRPKPLCPVGGLPLLDLAIARARTATTAVAVNVHHARAALEDHLAATNAARVAAGAGGPVHVSVEPDEALGTAGALAHLRSWIDGRGVLVLNGDTWTPGDLGAAAAGWDRERVRVLVVGDDRLWPPDRPTSRLAGSFMPWSEVARLEPVPSGLWEVGSRWCTGTARASTAARRPATSPPTWMPAAAPPWWARAPGSTGRSCARSCGPAPPSGGGRPWSTPCGLATA